jgi:hypothetical protein
MVLLLQMASKVTSLREIHQAEVALERLGLSMLPKVVIEVARSVKYFATLVVHALILKV